MYRYRELINQYIKEFGIIGGKRKAKEQYIQEELEKLPHMLYHEDRINGIIKILILMNKKD